VIEFYIPGVFADISCLFQKNMTNFALDMVVSFFSSVWVFHAHVITRLLFFNFLCVNYTDGLLKVLKSRSIVFLQTVHFSYGQPVVLNL